MADQRWRMNAYRLINMIGQHWATKDSIAASELVGSSVRLITLKNRGWNSSSFLSSCRHEYGHENRHHEPPSGLQGIESCFLPFYPCFRPKKKNPLGFCKLSPLSNPLSHLGFLHSIISPSFPTPSLVSIPWKWINVSLGGRLDVEKNEKLLTLLQICIVDSFIQLCFSSKQTHNLNVYCSVSMILILFF